MKALLKDRASQKPYTHLKKDEKEICKRFIEYSRLTGDYWYDVHLESKDLVFPAFWTKKDIQNWKTLMAKRIDLLVVQKDAHWIFEVTPKVSKAALGGCLTYKDLYIDQFEPKVPVKIGIVCELDDPTYHKILDLNDVRLFVV